MEPYAEIRLFIAIDEWRRQIGRQWWRWWGFFQGAPIKSGPEIGCPFNGNLLNGHPHSIKLPELKPEHSFSTECSDLNT